MGDAGNTKVLGTIEGEIDMPEISNDVIDDGDEWDIQVRCFKGDDNLVFLGWLRLHTLLI